MSQSVSTLVATLAVTSLSFISGCEKQPEAATATKPAGTPAADTHDDHDHGEEVNLGTQESGGFTLAVKHDGPITEGSEVPIDLTITKMPAGTTVNAVRFWIGNATAQGSMKAMAALEDDEYHAHVEVPRPLAADARIWVEVEASTGPAVVVSFELKK